ncbi:MAG: TonB family protein [Pseudomonadota bacterium]
MTGRFPTRALQAPTTRVFAVVVSLAFHGFALAAFMPRADEAEIERSSGSVAMMDGSLFDAVAATSEAERVEPVEIEDQSQQLEPNDAPNADVAETAPRSLASRVSDTIGNPAQTLSALSPETERVEQADMSAPNRAELVQASTAAASEPTQNATVSTARVQDSSEAANAPIQAARLTESLAALSGDYVSGEIARPQPSQSASPDTEDRIEPVEVAQSSSVASDPAQTTLGEIESSPAENAETAQSERATEATAAPTVAVAALTAPARPAVSEPERASFADIDPAFPDGVPMPSADPRPPEKRVAAVNPGRKTEATRTKRTATAKKPKRTQKKTAAKPSKAKTKQNTKKTNAGRGEINSRLGSQNARNGTARNAGDSGKRQTAGGARALSNYKGKVFSRIKRQARRLSGGRGKALVSLTINASGGLSRARVARSSGNASLDRKVLGAVQRAAPFPPLQKNTGQRSLTVSVWIEGR